jgi:UDP-glucose 4-epimerase
MTGTVLITGAAGSVGRALVQRLGQRDGIRVVATDVQPPPTPDRGVARILDVRDPGLADVLREHDVDGVVHLAAILSAPQGMSRETVRQIEVDGTQNVLDACLSAGVKRFVCTSSGAAYGYSPENGPLLDESAPLRGGEAFPYSHHKRLIEEMLVRYRDQHPELRQVVFRVSTILGVGVQSPITRLFERPVVLGLRGVDTPFCFVWDEDVVAALEQAIGGDADGTWNLTGDGVMTLREVAHGMGRRFLALPEGLLKKGLGLAHARGWSENSPEQTAFLRHRPVLSNERLKGEFGFVPSKSTREVFELYRSSRA